MRPSRRLTFPLVAAGLALIAGAAIAEVTVRVLNPKPRTQVVRPRHGLVLSELDGVPVWRVPHSSDDFGNLDCPARNPEARVVSIVGDSIPFAISGQQPPPQTISTLLQRRLGERWCVIDGPQPAFTGEQQLAVVRDHLERFEPDLVIWGAWKRKGRFVRVGDAAYEVSRFRTAPDLVLFFAPMDRPFADSVADPRVDFELAKDWASRRGLPWRDMAVELGDLDVEAIGSDRCCHLTLAGHAAHADRLESWLRAWAGHRGAGTKPPTDASVAARATLGDRPQTPLADRQVTVDLADEVVVIDGWSCTGVVRFQPNGRLGGCRLAADARHANGPLPAGTALDFHVNGQPQHAVLPQRAPEQPEEILDFNLNGVIIEARENRP